MRFQLFQVDEDDLIYEGMETDILVREGKAAFPFDAGVAGGKTVSFRRVVHLT